VPQLNSIVLKELNLRWLSQRQTQHTDGCNIS
jgi:hypothetical protein